jgi:hypothetical protein
MAPLDPQDSETSFKLEDCSRHLDEFVSNANNFHVKGDDKYTRSIECIVHMIVFGRFPDSDEMTTDEFGLRSMTNMDPSELGMSARQWEALGLLSSGKALDHMSMYGTDLTDDEYTANMYQMFINLPAEVITHIPNSPNSFAQNTSRLNR